MTDNLYQKENENFELELVDLTKGRTHKIKYDYVCMGVFKTSCVDSVVFSKNYVSIKTTLNDYLGSDKMINQTKKIKM